MARPSRAAISPVLQFRAKTAGRKASDQASPSARLWGAALSPRAAGCKPALFCAGKERDSLSFSFAQPAAHLPALRLVVCNKRVEAAAMGKHGKGRGRHESEEESSEEVCKKALL